MPAVSQSAPIPPSPGLKPQPWLQQQMRTALHRVTRGWGRRLVALVLVAIALLGVWGTYPAAALAEDAASRPEVTEPDLEAPAPSRSGVDANDISSEKVSQFVQAYLQVVDLVEQHQEELRRAETESESFRIQRSIESEALEVIETTGLTWQEYLQLLGLANTDPEFGERIAAQLQEASR